MNERIRLLWTQAEEEIKAEYEDESRRNRRLYNEIFLPKFAELIVAECVSIVARRKDQAIDDGCNVDEAMSMAEMDLLEHFGVEE